jgi:hypothetical protein
MMKQHSLRSSTPSPQPLVVLELTPNAKTHLEQIARRNGMTQMTCQNSRMCGPLPHLNPPYNKQSSNRRPDDRDLIYLASEGSAVALGAMLEAARQPWSNGQVEGQVNRLKLIKRQMYGRANFDLLRQRVLHGN